MMILSSCLNVFANETEVYPDRYEEYLQYLHEGWFSEGFTYEMWISLIKENEKLETMLTDEMNGFRCVHTEFVDENGGINESGNRAYSMIKGDILITNGTSMAGLTGHAGIAISSTMILSIKGPTYHPETISLSTWNNRYMTSNSHWTKYYRHNNYPNASAAANWGINTYVGSDAEYDLLPGLYNTDYTYCSKIVWQCYYYGPSTHQATTTSNHVTPYGLPDRVLNLTLKKTQYGGS